MAAFGIIAVALLLLGKLHSELIFPIGSLVALAVMLYIFMNCSIDRLGAVREKRIFDLLAILFVGAWVSFNVVYTAQHVFVNRDPAVYANTAAWLVGHDSLVITKSPVFGDVKGLQHNSAGFWLDIHNSEEIQAQGNHLLPILIGLAGRVVGDVHMLRAGPLLGGIALLAVYGLGRYLVRPRWIFIGMVALSVSMPMIYFSRSTYTEPLTMMFLFSALSLILIAQRTNKRSMYLLAGLVAGATFLTRIDALLIIVGLFAALFIYQLSLEVSKRTETLKTLLAFGSGVAVGTILGWLDVTILSSEYYRMHRIFIIPQLWLAFLTIVLGAVALAINRNTILFSRLDQKTKRWRGTVFAAIILAFVILLMSRPLWHTGFYPTQNPIVAQLQSLSGSPVEPRSYSEHTTDWILWYTGGLIALLGVLGLAFAAKIVMSKRSVITPLFTVTLVLSAVYLLKPSITPDQTWAIRRFLPVTIPGLIIFAVISMEYIYGNIFTRLQYKKLFAAIGVVAIILQPLIVSKPIIKLRDTAQLSALLVVCDTLSDDKAIIWFGTAHMNTTQSTRSYCNAPAAGYRSDNGQAPSQKTLAEIARNIRSYGLTPVVGFYGSESHLLDKKYLNQLTQVAIINWKELEQSLYGPPAKSVEKGDSIIMAEITLKGTLVPLHLKD